MDIVTASSAHRDDRVPVVFCFGSTGLVCMDGAWYRCDRSLDPAAWPRSRPQRGPFMNAPADRSTVCSERATRGNRLIQRKGIRPHRQPGGHDVNRFIARRSAASCLGHQTNQVRLTYSPYRDSRATRSPGETPRSYSTYSQRLDSVRIDSAPFDVIAKLFCDDAAAGRSGRGASPAVVHALLAAHTRPAVRMRR